MIFKRFIPALCAATVIHVPLAGALQQPVTPPVLVNGRIPPAVIGQSNAQVAPRSSIMTVKPWSQFLQATPANTFSSSGGHAFVGVFEAPDDYDAVQLVFANGGTSTWGIAGATVAPSSTYGSSLYGTSGVTPVDQSGNTISSALPVTFNGGGSYAQPWPPAMTQWTGNYTALNTAVLSLITNAATASGNNTLNFASTFTSNAYGSLQPTAGSYLSDGLGCIAAGTKISSVTSIAIVMTANAQAGCLSGQAIWITPAQPVLTATVPATTNPPARAVIFSDWIPVSSLARSDGGMIAGMSVSGTGIAAATTLAAAGVNSLSLSTPTVGTVAAGAAVTLSQVTTAVATVSAGYVVNLASTTGLRRGQTITHAAIPTGTTITYVGNGSVRLSSALTGTINAGDTVTVTQVSYTSNTSSLAAGQTSLPVISTSNRPLLLVRLLTSASAAPWAYYQCANAIGYEQALGLPEFAAFYIGGQSGGTAYDGVNQPGLLSNNGGGMGAGCYSPVYAINFHTRHRGVTVLLAGDSHAEGYVTASGEANFVRLAAAALSTPSTPVSFINEAYAGKTLNIYGPDAALWLNSVKPGVAVLQASTANGGGSAQGYFSDMSRLADLVQSYGGRPILMSDMPRASRQTLMFRTTQAVANSTVLPLDSYLSGYSGVVLAGTLAVTGPGIPSGTTTTLTTSNFGANSIALSAPVTLPAGTLISLGQLTVASSTTNSTSVTFTTQLPGATPNGISIPGCAATNFSGFTAQSATQTLNAACSLTAGAVMTLINPANNTQATEQTRAELLGLAGGSLSVFDAFAPGENPSDPGYWMPGYSLDGTHGDDAAMQVYKAAFSPLLQQVIGQ